MKRLGAPAAVSLATPALARLTTADAPQISSGADWQIMYVAESHRPISKTSPPC